MVRGEILEIMIVAILVSSSCCSLWESWTDHERRACDRPRRRAGIPPLSAHAPALEAGGADRRQVPPHRRAHQQLPARRPAADLRADAVQLGVAEPSRRADLSHGSVLARLRRHHRRRADAGQLELVSGHGRRGAAGGPALQAIRRRLLPDSRRRPSLSHGLRADARRARRPGRRHHRRRAAGDAAGRAGDGHLPFRSRRADRGVRGEAGAATGWRRSAAACRRARCFAIRSTTPRSRSSRRWASTCSRARCCSSLLQNTDGHRFRARDHPGRAQHAPRARLSARRLLGRRRNRRVVLRREHHAHGAARAVQVLRSAQAHLHARAVSSAVAHALVHGARIDRRRRVLSRRVRDRAVRHRHPHAHLAGARASRARCCSARTCTNRTPRSSASAATSCSIASSSTRTRRSATARGW